MMVAWWLCEVIPSNISGIMTARDGRFHQTSQYREMTEGLDTVQMEQFDISGFFRAADIHLSIYPLVI